MYPWPASNFRECLFRLIPRIGRLVVHIIFLRVIFRSSGRGTVIEGLACIVLDRIPAVAVHALIAHRVVIPERPVCKHAFLKRKVFRRRRFGERTHEIGTGKHRHSALSVRHHIRCAHVSVVEVVYFDVVAFRSVVIARGKEIFKLASRKVVEFEVGFRA